MISEIEDDLGIRIDVEARNPTLKDEIDFHVMESGNSIEIVLASEAVGKIVSIHLEDEFLTSATVGKRSIVKISKSSEAGRKIANAVLTKSDLKVLV